MRVLSPPVTQQLQDASMRCSRLNPPGRRQTQPTPHPRETPAAPHLTSGAGRNTSVPQQNLDDTVQRGKTGASTSRPDSMASGCVRGGSDGTPGKISLLKEWSGLGPGCPGQWGSPHPWRGSKTVWMWPLGTWVSRHGGVGLAVGLDDLRGLFQP